MTVQQISIFLENRPGQLAAICRTLAAICRTLAKAGVNIVTLSLADTADFGIVRMIVDDHVRGAKVLADAGFAVRETEVVTATVRNEPGGMAELMEKFDAAGVDIEYSYAYALGNGKEAILVFRFKDNAKALAALG